MEESKKKKIRFGYIDLLETIAIICIVFYHGAIGNANILSGKMIGYVNYFIQTLVAVAVPLFFVVNGFLLFGRGFNLKKHIRKTIRVAAIAIIWGVITIIFLMFIRGEYLSAKEFLLTFWQTRPNWTSHLWFLGELVCIYLLFPVLYYIHRDQRKIFIYFVVIGIAMIFGNTFLNEMGMLATVVIRHPKNISGINFFNMFNPFTGNNPCDIIYFCIGGLIYTYKNILEKVHIMKCKVLMVLGFLLNNICLFIIGILYSKITNTLWDTVWEGRSTIFVLLNVIYVFLFFMDFNKNNRLQKQSEITLKDRFCKCIEVISKNTMGIYLVHVLVLRTIEKFSIQASFTSNITVGIIYSIVVTLISLIITLCVKRIPVVGKFI